MHRVNLRTLLILLRKIYNLHLSVYLTLELDHKLVKLYLLHHQLFKVNFSQRTRDCTLLHCTALSNKVLGQFIWKQ